MVASGGIALASIYQNHLKPSCCALIQPITNASVQTSCHLVEDEVKPLFSSSDVNKCFSNLTPHDPTLTFSCEITDTLSWAFSNQLITQDKYKFLLQEHPIRPIFYTSPKIRKSCEEPIPGRPIASGIGSLPEPISQFVNFQI